MFTADDEDAAAAIMNGDPAIAEGVVRGELRPFQVGFFAGRD